VIRYKDRDKLQKYLNENDIQTMIHYPIPPHKQKAYPEWSGRKYEITEDIHRQVISLPVSPSYANDEAASVVDRINLFSI